MKNVTLSMPESLLIKSREYASKHGTTLNQMIRDLLTRNVAQDGEHPIDKLIKLSETIKINTKDVKFDRNEIHKR